jgi:hypothetical protein
MLTLDSGNIPSNWPAISGLGHLSLSGYAHVGERPGGT